MLLVIWPKWGYEESLGLTKSGLAKRAMRRTETLKMNGISSNHLDELTASVPKGSLINS
jgi:hypothetical protein